MNTTSIARGFRALRLATVLSLALLLGCVGVALANEEATTGPSTVSGIVVDVTSGGRMVTVQGADGSLQTVLLTDGREVTVGSILQVSGHLAGNGVFIADGQGDVSATELDRMTGRGMDDVNAGEAAPVDPAPGS